MTEMVLETKTLPEELSRLVGADKVKVVKEGDEIRMTPMAHAGRGCPFRGLFADGTMSTRDFLESKAAEKELEDRRFP